MKVVIDIPKDFTGDYIADKFKDFFSRAITDMNYLCGNYERETAEMFIIFVMAMHMKVMMNLASMNGIVKCGNVFNRKLLRG